MPAIRSGLRFTNRGSSVFFLISSSWDEPLRGVRRPGSAAMHAGVRQNDNHRAVGQKACDTRVVGVSAARMHDLRYTAVAHVDARAVAVVNLVRRLAADVHQWRLELPA